MDFVIRPYQISLSVYGEAGVVEPALLPLRKGPCYDVDSVFPSTMGKGLAERTLERFANCIPVFICWAFVEKLRQTDEICLAVLPNSPFNEIIFFIRRPSNLDRHHSDHTHFTSPLFLLYLHQ